MNPNKPVLNGITYCSPDCGNGCTHAAYLAAKEEAAKTAKALGPGWKPQVWENSGWHWMVKHPAGMTVFKPIQTQYFADYCKKVSVGEGMFHTLQLRSTAKTPRHAVSLLLTKMIRFAGSVDAGAKQINDELHK